MKTTTIKTAAFTALAPIAVSLLFAVMILGSSSIVKASDLPEVAAQPTRGTCAFSLQLQKSVAAQRAYLVKLDQARGTMEMARNSLEEAYDNAKLGTSGDKGTAEVAWSISEVGFGLE
jgi:hypothetical protein